LTAMRYSSGGSTISDAIFAPWALIVTHGGTAGRARGGEGGGGMVALQIRPHPNPWTTSLGTAFGFGPSLGGALVGFSLGHRLHQGYRLGGCLGDEISRNNMDAVSEAHTLLARLPAGSRRVRRSSACARPWACFAARAALRRVRPCVRCTRVPLTPRARVALGWPGRAFMSVPDLVSDGPVLVYPTG
jgi:hypothetical protein